MPSLATPSVQPFTFYTAHYSAALQLCQVRWNSLQYSLDLVCVFYQNGNGTACQLILNLCVLQSYNRQDPACEQSINLASTQ